MNERKKLVIDKAHQLFIDKGFQATSIQDILDFSGISKGTFYNYFSSKNELLIAIFKSVYQQMEKARDELLIGQDPADLEIFTQQLVLQMKTNRKNKLITLFEEVMVSNDQEIMEFIKKGQLRTISWLYMRLIDIFGEGKRPYLLDCSVMFMGIMQFNIKYNYMAKESALSIQHVTRYGVERLIRLVQDVSESGDQLLEPELLERWLPDCRKNDKVFQHDLYQTVLSLKKSIPHDADHAKYFELLDFIQEELLESKKPRKHLIDITMTTLNNNQLNNQWQTDVNTLEQLISSYFLSL